MGGRGGGVTEVQERRKKEATQGFLTEFLKILAKPLCHLEVKPT